MASSGCKFRKLQCAGARQWSVTSFGVQFASCECYPTQALQSCGVLCKEPEARCTWLEFYTTAVCRGCSEPVSDSFGTRVLSFTQLRCAVGAVNQFLTASVHGCSTASGCKLRKLERTGARQWSVTSSGVQSASCEYYFTRVFPKLRCAVQGTRGSVCEDS